MKTLRERFPLAMDKLVERALARDRVIDITTEGRKTGKARRIEIWFFNLDGRFYITGSPGRRSWYANILAHPEFTFHVKGSAKADLPARARPIVEQGERREVLTKIQPLAGTFRELEPWVKGSPLIEVTFEQPANTKHTSR
jgi:deazaflavin-dependent oxidoreductase (nitroreductase family)